MLLASDQLATPAVEATRHMLRHNYCDCNKDMIFIFEFLRLLFEFLVIFSKNFNLQN